MIETKFPTYVICSGGWDPCHKGHIAYLEAAKRLGNYLIVGCNTDEWLTRKKGRPFMDYENRVAVMKALRCVDWVMHFNDDDNSASNLIENAIIFGGPNARYIFANGGDRTAANIPEMGREWKADVLFAFGVGGREKVASSSDFLKKWALENPSCSS